MRRGESAMTSMMALRLSSARQNVAASASLSLAAKGFSFRLFRSSTCSRLAVRGAGYCYATCEVPRRLRGSDYNRQVFTSLIDLSCPAAPERTQIAFEIAS
jgi:hypothetical protein